MTRTQLSNECMSKVLKLAQKKIQRLTYIKTTRKAEINC